MKLNKPLNLLLVTLSIFIVNLQANIGKTSQILSNIGDIVLNANNNIYLVGSNLKSNANLILNAGNSILSDTIKDSARYDFTYSYGYDKGEYSFNKGSNLISQQNILLNANNNIALISTNLNATKKALLNAKNSIDISSSTNMDFRETLFKEKNPISKKSTMTTTYNQTINPSNIIANDIELNANSITLTASNIQANNINITTNSLNLTSDKNTNSHTEFTNKSGIITTTVQDKGKITQVEIPAIIRVNDKFILNGKDITNNLDIKTYNQISNKLNSQEFKENIIKELSSNSKTPLNDTTINQVKATLNSKEWNEKTTTLSGVGSLIITAVVTYLTAGAGSALSGALSTAGASATMTATTTAITSAVTTNLSLQTTNYIISNGKVKFDLDSLTKSAISAGIGSLASSYINGINLGDSAGANIAKSTLNSTANAGINSAIYGTDFKDNLIANLTNQVTDTLYKQVGDIAFTQGEANNNDYFKEGSLGKVALHATTGGIASKLMGDKFATGAISAGLNEALSPLFSKDTSSMSKEELAKYNTQRLALSQLIGTISGSIVGGQDSANTAFTISTSAALNNRQLHQEQIDFLSNDENIEKFRQKLNSGTGNEYDLQTARDILTNQTLRNSDYLWSLTLKEFSPTEQAIANSFLTENTKDIFTYTNGYKENAFNVTQRDFYDHRVNLNTALNNLDFYRTNAYHLSTQNPTINILKDGANLATNVISNLPNLATAPSNLLQDFINNPIDTANNVKNSLSNGLIGIYENAIDGTTNSIQNLNPYNIYLLNQIYGQDVGTASSILSIMQMTEATAMFNGIYMATKKATTSIAKTDIKNTPNTDNNLNSNSNTNNNGNNFNGNNGDEIVVAGGSDIVNKNIDIIFKDNQLQKKLKHAEDFNLPTKYTKENLSNFKEAIVNHINSTTTTKIDGTYRGQPVTHYVDKKTGLNVIIDNNGEFLSGWKLNDSQLKNVINRGSL